MAKTVAWLGAGVLLFVLAFPPADLGFLGFVALVPFAAAFHRAAGPGAWLVAYAAGAAIFLAACFWIAETAWINLIAVAAVQGWFLPLFGVLYRIGVRRGRLPVWICVPVAWMAVEYVRATFPLDGFPWLLLGYTAWRIPPLLQTADLFGVWGPGFLMAFCSGVIAHYMLQRRPAAAVPRFAAMHGGAVIFAALAAAAVVYGAARPGAIRIEPGPIVAAIQGNIPQYLKGSSASFREVHETYAAATRQLMESGRHPIPDLVVWPETIYGLPISEGAAGEIWFPEEKVGDERAREIEKQWLVEQVVHKLTGPAGAWFLVGAVSYRLGPDGGVERRNSVLLYDPEGNRRSSYSKTILVPGGEYLPLISYLPFREPIEKFVLGVAGFLPDLEAGDGPRLHTIAVHGREYVFGTQICFENIYGAYNRRFVRLGAEFMINISNEGWFGDSAEFDQMLAMSLFRAVETRRSLFRSTNTGISCVISPLGEIPRGESRVVQAGRDRGVAGVISREVPLCTARTLFTAIGNLAGLIVAGVQILLLLISFLKSSAVTIPAPAANRA